MGTLDNMAPLPEGTRLEKYELLAVLGQGGGGITYRAVDRQLQREVAIKEHFPQGLCERTRGTAEVLPIQGAAYAQSLHSFCRGARILAGLNHPCVAKVHEIFSACNTAFLVMEYVEGVPLTAWLRTAPSSARMVRMVEQMLAALGYLHSCEVIHRDIKPTNILVKEDETPVLIDFDAAMVGEPTHTLTQVGTPGYAAPEQFTPGQVPGPQADIYALGRTVQRAAADAGVLLPRRIMLTLKKACAESWEKRYGCVADWQRALRGGMRWWVVAGGGLVVVALISILVCVQTVPPPVTSSAVVLSPQKPERVVRSKEHPIELVIVGNDLRLKKTGSSEPELQGEKDFQNAVLAAQQETDAACKTLYENEVKSGKITEIQYNRQRYDLEQALNQKVRALIDAYIEQTFDGIDPQPGRTQGVFNLLEIQKMRHIASQAVDYPLHPRYLIKYDVNGNLIIRKRGGLTPREEAFVQALLTAQDEYERELAQDKEKQEAMSKLFPRMMPMLNVVRPMVTQYRFNMKVANLISEYVAAHFDENFSFIFETKPLVREVLSKRLPRCIYAPIIKSYPNVMDVGFEQVHRELNGEKRLLKMKCTPSQGEDFSVR